MKSISTAPIRIKATGEVIPANTECQIRFDHSTKYFVMFPDGREFSMPCNRLPKWFGKDFETPDMESLAEWVNEGICETVLGNSTEPDGYDSEGSPSWLLALGMI